MQVPEFAGFCCVWGGCSFLVVFNVVVRFVGAFWIIVMVWC